MIPTSSLAYTLVFLVGGMSCIMSQEYNCKQNDKTIVVSVHTLKNGMKRCCNQITCNKGTYGVPCEHDRPETTRCQDCDEQNYYNPGSATSDIQTYCLSKTSCSGSSGLVAADNGSTYENRKCKCDLQRGFYMSAKGFHENASPTCQRKSCPAGEELHDDGECRECQAFTFKSESGYHQCQKNTDCKKLGLQIDRNHQFNATQDTVCYNESAIGRPVVGPVEEDQEKNYKTFIIIGGVIGMVMVMGGVGVFLLWRHHKAGADNDSQGSAGERKTCLSESSVSDQEDNVENGKRVIKRDHDLKVDIPITFGDKLDLKGNHTPDSGIFTGYPPHMTPSMNGGPFGHNPPPYFISNLPSTGLETDAEVFQGRPPESPSNDSDLHSTSGVSSCPSKEEKLSEERNPGTPSLTGAPPVIHIHHHYRQVGNRNQMVVKPTALAAADYLKQGQISGDSNCEYENDSYGEEHEEEEEEGEYGDSEYESGPEYQRSTTV